MDFHVLDLVLAVLVIILGLKGLLKGMVKELFGLIGLVGGVFFASRFASEFGGYIRDNVAAIENEGLVTLVGFAAFFAMFWAGMVSLGTLLSKMVKISGLGFLDKLAGAVLGSAKVFFIFSIIAYALGSIEFIRNLADKHLEGSVAYPLLYKTGETIVKLDNPLTRQAADAAEEGISKGAAVVEEAVKGEAAKEVEKRVREMMEKQEQPEEANGSGLAPLMEKPAPAPDEDQEGEADGKK